MYNCIYCDKKFSQKYLLVNHYKKEHNLSFTFDQEYKLKNYILENKEIPKCKYCNNDIFVKCKRGSVICDNKECRKKHFSEIQKNIHKQHPELTINARKRRIEYLSNKENFEKTAYGIRANKNMSYIEKWFLENIIIKFDLYKKYLIVNEYKLTNENYTSAYSLDFAFIDIRLDVELDGKQHFIHDTRIEHDINRDNFLKSNGWNIYRISIYDIKNNCDETINNFINFLSDIKIDFNLNKYYENNKILSNNEYKKIILKKKNKEELKNQKYSLNKNILIDLELNSKIDFTKFGWVTKAYTYLLSKNIKITQLHKFIKRYYPEFFTNTNAFIRKQ